MIEEIKVTFYTAGMKPHHLLTSSEALGIIYWVKPLLPHGWYCKSIICSLYTQQRHSFHCTSCYKESCQLHKSLFSFFLLFFFKKLSLPTFFKVVRSSAKKYTIKTLHTGGRKQHHYCRQPEDHDVALLQAYKQVT